MIQLQADQKVTLEWSSHAIWLAIYDPKGLRKSTPLLFGHFLELTDVVGILVIVKKVQDCVINLRHLT